MHCGPPTVVTPSFLVVRDKLVVAGTIRRVIYWLTRGVLQRPLEGRNL